MIAGKPLAYIAVGILVSVCFGVGKTVGGEQHQNPFHTYVLDTGWGTSGAAFSPDDRFVAVLSRKEPSQVQGLEAVEKIQIWDFRTNKLILEKVLAPDWLPPSAAARERETFLYSYSPSGSAVVLYRNGHVVLLDSSTLDEVRNIDLHIEAWPKFPPNSGCHAFVKKVSLDRRADRAAVLLEWCVGGGGELRVYDLHSGDLIRKWDYRDLWTGNYRDADFGGIDISPDGGKVAVSVIPFVLGEGSLHASDRNVFVLDVDSGEKAAEMNTGYPAGDVSFAATNPLTLLTVSADNLIETEVRETRLKFGIH